jgi:uncharacterized protein YegL
MTGHTSAMPDPTALGIQRRQLHILFVLDCSGSMTGEKIASLNYAMATSIPAMRAAAEDNPETDVRVRVMRFSDAPAWQTPEAVPVAAFTWQELTAQGETNAGAALALLAAGLTPEAMPGRQLAPIIVLVSDGQPTDDFAAGLAALLNSPFGAKSIRIAIAIGQDADLDVLKGFIGHADFQVLAAHNAQDLVNRIKWATTAPMKAVSQPAKTGGGGTMAALAADAAAQAQTPAKDISDLVW